MFPRGNLFALWVHGESMVKVGITDGDLAVIRQQATVEDGEIAAVQIGEEATLKRVYAEKNHVRLKAENDTFSDMLVANNSGADVRVLGLYVGLIRPARLRQCKVRS
jgi:repressor LexA